MAYIKHHRLTLQHKNGLQYIKNAYITKQKTIVFKVITYDHF
jgi:hypothetical protein